MNVRCPDCRIDMDEGFVTDCAPGGVTQTWWHPGPATEKKILGLPAGVQVRKDQLKPIVSLRCSKCGLLKHYAP